MLLLEINRAAIINASIRLDEPIAEQFAQYAAFVHTSADDVVDKALNCVSNDRDFQDLLKAPQVKQVASTFVYPEGREQRCGGASGVLPSGFVPVTTGWILRLISWRSKHGASHRKNVDTSPPSWELRSARQRFDFHAG